MKWNADTARVLRDFDSACAYSACIAHTITMGQFGDCADEIDRLTMEAFGECDCPRCSGHPEA